MEDTPSLFPGVFFCVIVHRIDLERKRRSDYCQLLRYYYHSYYSDEKISTMGIMKHSTMVVSKKKQGNTQFRCIFGHIFNKNYLCSHLFFLSVFTHESRDFKIRSQKQTHIKIMRTKRMKNNNFRLPFTFRIAVIEQNSAFIQK